MNIPDTFSRKSEDLSLDDVFKPKIVNSSTEVRPNGEIVGEDREAVKLA